MTRLRRSWRCAACGGTILRVGDLWHDGLFVHRGPAGVCATEFEPIEVVDNLPSVAEVMAAARVDMPQETLRERREERAALAEWPGPPYGDGL